METKVPNHDKTVDVQDSDPAMKKSWSQRSRSKSPRPAHHANDDGTAFQNPWPSAQPPTVTERAQHSFPLSWYNSLGLNGHESAREVKVVKPDWGASSLKSKGLRRDQCVVGTWLGHAGALVEFPLTTGTTTGSETTDTKSCWLLFDPIFSMRSGPTQYIGPRRMKKSPCQVIDLPGCDAVFISHNHFDHLDLPSIQALLKEFPKARYFVPLGNRSWMIETGVPEAQVFELDWWQSREFSVKDFIGHRVEESLEEGDNGDKTSSSVRFTCVPAQHRSGRNVIDEGCTLWSGWVAEHLVGREKDKTSDPATIETKNRRGAVYHAGDTGYRRSAKSDVVCPAFKEIGEKLGPFDLSFLPIWRGGTLGFISYLGLRLSHRDISSSMHGSPMDAVDMHLDVKSKNSVGIHFGTFIGSENESYEAVIEFTEACQGKAVSGLDESAGDHGRAGVVDIGGSLAVRIG